jgi:hypothetical protein
VVAVAPRRQDGIYKGALAKPIVLGAHYPFWGPVVPERKAAYQQLLSRYERRNAAIVKRQYEKKLAMLFDHYGIADKKNWAALASALAEQHVPGFTIQFYAKSKRGRKKTWDPNRLHELDRTVQSIKQQHALNDRRALTFMVNNKEHTATWGPPTGHKGSKQQWIETLEARLQDAKKLRKIHGWMESDLQRIAASMKFRK